MNGIPNVSQSDVRKGRKALRAALRGGMNMHQAEHFYAGLIADAVVTEERPYGPWVYAYAVCLRWHDVQRADELAHRKAVTR